MSDKYKHYTREDLEDAIDRLREDILIQTQKVITLRAALKPFADLSSHWEGDKMPLKPKTITIDPLPVLYAVKETRND